MFANHDADNNEVKAPNCNDGGVEPIPKFSLVASTSQFADNLCSVAH
jgi:hypothetical protein